MLARELVAELEFENRGADLDKPVRTIVSDTRSEVSGAVFVCIAGARFDSHTMAAEMVRRGALFCVCDHEIEASVPHLLVPDTRAALSLLWSAWYGHPERAFSTIIGITGTNGKTSTSLMIRQILSHASYRCGVIGTTKYIVGDKEYDAPLTTPDPEQLFRYFAEMIENGLDTLIMEVSSHSLAQRRVEGIPFTVGIFTNLTQDHLDYHGTMEAYRKEKEKLFSLCKLGLINADDPASGYFLESAACKTYTYGEKAGVNFCASDLTLDALGVGYRYLEENAEQGEIRLAIPGKFSVYNSLAAISCARLLHVDFRTCREAIERMPGVPGRMQRVPDTGNVTVLLDYAHTPDALENVLSSVRGFCRGRILCVFGCGGDRDHTKRPIMGRIACSLSDLAFITSDNPRTEDPEAIIRDVLLGCAGYENKYRVVCDRSDAIRAALDEARDDDVVLLAGKGHEQYVIDRTGKHPYSEKAVVTEYFKTIGKAQA